MPNKDNKPKQNNTSSKLKKKKINEDEDIELIQKEDKKTQLDKPRSNESSSQKLKETRARKLAMIGVSGRY